MTRIARSLPSRATALAAALLAGWSVAQAAATPEQLAGVKLYGDVTIAQDRVDQWGPWEEFEPPAAGPLVFLADLRFDREFRDEPDIEDPDVVARLCEAGSLCGYGLEGLLRNVDNQEDRFTPLQLITLDQSQISTEGELSKGLVVQLQDVLSGTTITSPLLIQPEGAVFIYRSDDPRDYAWLLHEGDEQVPTDWLNMLLSYTQGDAAEPRQVAGLVGRVTSTERMNALVTEGRTATYRGWDMHAQNAKRGEVTLTVNFGTGRFNYATSGGIQSYQAAGVVRGSGYVATSFTTPGTSGTLQGNFIGSNAQGTVGGATVTQGGVTHMTVHVTRRAQDPQ